MKLISDLYQVLDNGDEIYPNGLFNLESNDELRTEELFWYPNDEKFETQKFVTIKTNNEIHSGEGMESNQDFSNYKILRPTGTIEIDEN